MLDRLVIGTANWGREYNGHCVDETQQQLIMEYMKEVGIEWLDVATAYRTEQIGRNEFKRIVKSNHTAWPDDDIILSHSRDEYKSCIHDGLSIYNDVGIVIPVNARWIELPYSIMDNKLLEFNIEPEPPKLIARSIFCKGKALKYFSPRECIDFVLMNPRIDKVILGVDSVDQLRDNIAHLVKMEKFEHNEEVDTRKF